MPETQTSHSRPRIALLTVGTEITTGQILNRNTQNLSQWLTDMGLEVSLQLSVADDHQDILNALTWAQQRIDLIITTGGLGPTSDDFTRNVVADWCQSPLLFDECSWQQIEGKLSRAGVPVSASNRQQCFFPQGSQIFENRAGTANGFSFMNEHAKIKVLCLPGPPSEIEALWKDHIHSWMSQQFILAHPPRLFRWQCLGKSESSLCEIVDSILGPTPLLVGYRPHVPYVEVKVWASPQQAESYKSILQQLDVALSEWTVAKDDEDNCFKFIKRFEKPATALVLIDPLSQGLVAERLIACKRQHLIEWNFVYFDHPGSQDCDYQLSTDQHKHGGARLQLSATDVSIGFEVYFSWQDQQRNFQIRYPFRYTPERKQRALLYGRERLFFELANIGNDT